MFYLFFPLFIIAKKLSLYQVLAPNAFSPVEEFVPILQKTVSSTLHEVDNENSFLVFPMPLVVVIDGTYDSVYGSFNKAITLSSLTYPLLFVISLMF